MYAGLGCLLSFFLVLILLFISTVGNLLRVLFGFNSLHKRTTNKQQQQTYTQRPNSSNATSSSEGKIFDKNDGEYVDFEEIKE